MRFTYIEFIAPAGDFDRVENVHVEFAEHVAID